MFKRKHLLVCAVGVVSLIATSAFAQTCKITPITVAGAAGTSAYGVNRFDKVAGAYLDSATFHLRAYTWSQGAITKFNYPGAISTQYRGINDSGTIVGSFVTSDHRGHGLVRSNGKSIVFNFPKAFSTLGMGINNSGTIVGSYSKSLTGRFFGFIKTSGGWATLNFPNSTSTLATSIADGNEVVGVYSDAGGQAHGFTYKGGVYTRVDFPGAGSTGINGVNKYGNVVGDFQSGKDQPVQAWDRKGGTFRQFTWRNATSISLDGINNLGDEVGSAGLSGSEPGFLRICR